MPTGDAPTTSEWSTISFPTKVRLISEVWGLSLSLIIIPLPNSSVTTMHGLCITCITRIHGLCQHNQNKNKYYVFIGPLVGIYSGLSFYATGETQIWTAGAEHVAAYLLAYREVHMQLFFVADKYQYQNKQVQSSKFKVVFIASHT